MTCALVEGNEGGSRAQLALPLLPALAVLLSYWPVLVWYVRRVTDGSDEPFGVLAFLAALFVVFQGVGPRSRENSIQTLSFVGGISLMYLIYGSELPMLGQGALLAISLSVLLSESVLYRRCSVALFGLFLLSLPIIASLQFFLGFPLRLLTAKLTAALLSICGWSVSAQGTLLEWGSELVALDAPCSGVKMLWGGLFLHFFLSAQRDVTNRVALIGYSITVAIVFLGNLLRSFLLFFTESGIVVAPPWVHPLIGLICFAGVVILILSLHEKLREV